MKIAFLTFYSGQIDRGVEVANEVLAQRLSKKFDITLFQAGSQITSQVKIIKIVTEKKWPLDSNQSIWRRFYLDYYSIKILQFTLKFMAYFLRQKYDVVIPTNGGWQVVLCRLLTWAGRKKMIVQGNAGIGADDLWQALCFPDYFIAISPQGYQWIKQKTPWLNINYIPYGVDLKQFKSAKALKLELPHPIILCVSAFLPYKRIDLLIKAVSKIKEASLLLIGHGPQEQELINLGKQLLKDRFLVKTNITHDQLISYYKSVDVFSLPSKSTEAFGLVYLEAMAAGLPVVATDDVNRRQIIGNAGILVNPENIDEYSKALTQTLHTDFKDQPTKQAAKFDWSIIIDKYQRLFTNL